MRKLMCSAIVFSLLVGCGESISTSAITGIETTSSAQAVSAN